jgi:type IV secretory pathway VirB3-like protein
LSTLFVFLFRLPRVVGVPIAVLGLALLALVLGLLVASLPILLCVLSVRRRLTESRQRRLILAALQTKGGLHAS